MKSVSKAERFVFVVVGMSAETATSRFNRLEDFWKDRRFFLDAVQRSLSLSEEEDFVTPLRIAVVSDGLARFRLFFFFKDEDDEDVCCSVLTFDFDDFECSDNNIVDDVASL